MSALALQLDVPSFVPGVWNNISERANAMPANVNTSTATDEQLAEAARGGDTNAFEELVGRHRHRVYARAFTMLQHHDDALDLCQEAWLKIWQKLHQFQSKSSFVTWMTRIVINLCLDQLRRRHRHPADSLDLLKEKCGDADLQMPVVHINPTEGLEGEELRERISAALAQLSPEHRTVLVLHEFEEMPYKDIARTMGCSIGTVMSRLFYARRNLAALLADQRAE
jgi:RNA polymerase sigma-70 factor (ECF subfamily)